MFGAVWGAEKIPTANGEGAGEPTGCEQRSGHTYSEDVAALIGQNQPGQRNSGRVVVRTGRQTKPTTKLGELTALKVAAGLAGVTLHKIKFKRAIRTVKKQLALHTRKRAWPLSLTDLKSIVKNIKYRYETRLAVLFAWALGLRLGTLLKIRCGHITLLNKRTVCRVKVVAWKGQDLGDENRYKFFPLTGLFRHLRQFLLKASLRHKRLLIFSRATPRRVFRILRDRNLLYSGHSVRRGAAQHLAEMGFSETKIQHFLLHKAISSTRVYIDPSLAQKKTQQELRMANKLLTPI